MYPWEAFGRVIASRPGALWLVGYRAPSLAFYAARPVHFVSGAQSLRRALDERAAAGWLLVDHDTWAGLSGSEISSMTVTTTSDPHYGGPPAPFDSPSSFGNLFSDLGRELARLPSKRNAITLGVGAALALAVHPADRVLTRRATSSEPLDRVFEFGEMTGSGWAQAGAALGTFVGGRLTGNRRIQAVGADLVQAQIVNSVITQGIKLAVNRARPDDGRFSFPSGHASGALASATVLHRHFGWKVGVPAYALATYVGASRLQGTKHYASDVIFGAAVGIVAGRTVTVGRGATRFAVSPIAVRGGAGLSFTQVP